MIIVPHLSVSIIMCSSEMDIEVAVRPTNLVNILSINRMREVLLKRMKL